MPVLAAISIGILFLAITTHGWLAPPASLGTVLVAVAAAVLTLELVAKPFSPVGRILSITPFQEIGQRSYGLYIWHLPIFRWIAEQDLSIPDPISVGIKYGLTFTVAWISFRFI